MRICILTINIGTGLAIDARILGTILKQPGHSVEVHEMRNRPAKYAPLDCAIFLERFDPKWAGRFNVFVPNHEWIKPNDVPLLARFELVACKTREAMQRIRGVARDRMMFLGFTSLDRYRGDVTQRFDECLHIAGCSAQKGTDSVLAAWAGAPDLPKINIIDWRSKRPEYPSASNVNLILDRISDDALMELMNRCGVHVCPSSTEGFGHTIHEAMSCGAVLLTTDAPPMNELTKNCAVLVKPAKQGSLGLAVTHEVEPSQVASGVRKIMSMSDDQRRALGRSARTTWEQNAGDFRRNVETMARIIAERLGRATGVTHAPRGSGFGSNSFRA